jgi:mannitol-1-/sugar-/sorbitol-6-/2-deoxyglucose-6-phosphatase
MNIKEFEAVIFDMDGVLIDSEPLWKIAMEEVFMEVGCPLTKKDFQKTVGLRIDEVINFWFNHIGWEGLSEKEVEEKIIQKMITLIEKNGNPLTGVLETLQFLKAKQLKIGLATSSYTILIDTVLKTLNIQHYFDFTHSAEYEDFGKPHPAVYLSVAKKLGVSPFKCLVIEDSLNGIISGKAARMKVVCIPEKSHVIDSKLNLADHTFLTMKELLTSIQ